MEQIFKVYIYAEGERPIFHQPPLKGIYASEGWFMKLLRLNKKFVTKKPKKAHLFYLPFSSRMLEVALYVPDSHNRKPLIQQLVNYVQLIKSKYNFWNRTDGADHFLVACHDWVCLLYFSPSVHHHTRFYVVPNADTYTTISSKYTPLAPTYSNKLKNPPYSE